MSHFRFLHLSDLHIAEEPNHLNRHEKIREVLSGGISDVARKEVKVGDVLSLLRPTSHSKYAKFMAAKFCYDHRDDVDALIITGDIATTGRDKDLRPARDYVSKNVKSFFYNWDSSTSLAAGGRKIYVLPGNHDRYNTFIPPSANCLNFENYFPDALPLGRRVHSFTRTKEGASIGFVFGDFCIRNNSDVKETKDLWGQGVAYQSILDEMSQETRRLRVDKPGILVMWAIHFAPFDCGEELELKNGASVVDEARRNNIKHILCGHTHNREKVPLKGVTIYCAGATCSMDREGSHEVHILDVKITKRSSSVRRENYFLGSKSGEFTRIKGD